MPADPRRATSTAATLAVVALSALAATAQVDDHRQIEYPELADFSIPEPEVYRLDNGLTVFLLEDHELPLLQITARVRTGSLWEPAEKVGLAGLMGAVQRTGGTRSMTGDEIDDFLEARAASVETSVSEAVGFASMDCLAEDVDEVLPVFVEVLRHPVFDAEKLEIAKVQVNASIARRNDSVDAWSTAPTARWPGSRSTPPSPPSSVRTFSTGTVATTTPTTSTSGWSATSSRRR